ncbi:hypothetical protein K457DRAFT_261725 [Linnemannia elongata AG-77]|uniref:Secreted protein n=1 Tax=Linnemannia elongata AG-77 TaxID=1314771 RepID=A0A197JDB6_9FUNG|nr:hypothetical protein K457DRAFT_261725 [Linnemannia elongata AG-77]
MRFWAEYFSFFFLLQLRALAFSSKVECSYRMEAFRRRFAFFVIVAFLWNDAEEQERRSPPSIASYVPLTTIHIPSLPLLSSLSVFPLPLQFCSHDSSLHTHTIECPLFHITHSHTPSSTTPIPLLHLPRLYLFKYIHPHIYNTLLFTFCSTYSVLLEPSSHPTITQLHRHFLLSNR